MKSLHIIPCSSPDIFTNAFPIIDAFILTPLTPCPYPYVVARLISPDASRTSTSFVHKALNVSSDGRSSAGTDDGGPIDILYGNASSTKGEDFFHFWLLPPLAWVIRLGENRLFSKINRIFQNILEAAERWTKWFSFLLPLEIIKLIRMTPQLFSEKGKNGKGVKNVWKRMR